MKVLSKFRVGFVLALICAMMISMAAAEEQSVNTLPGTGWSTGIQIQNVGSADATIELTGYARSDGTAAASANATVAPGASANFTTYPAGSTSFDGSGVVSADQPIVAIVNVSNGGLGPQGVAAEQYQGTDGSRVAPTVNFPLAKNNFGNKCTTFYVQNAGTADGDITATYSNGSTQTVTGVKPGQTVLFDPAAATPALPSDAPYALSVTSSQNLAGVVLEHFCANADSLQATRGFVAADQDTTVLSPIYKVRFGSRSNGLQVQNVNSGNIDITVTFSCSTGPCAGNTFTHTAEGVAPNASATFFNNAILGATSSSKSGDLPDGSLSAATITAVESGTSNAVPVVAINNETFNTPLPANVVRNTQTTFSALGLNAASAKVGVPLVKELFANKTTGIQVQNASTSAPVTVQVAYNMTNGPAACQGTFTAQNIEIPASSSVTLFKPSSAALPGGGTWDSAGAVKAGCFGGAVISVTSASGSVVSIIQETDLNTDPVLRQDNKNYEGFPIQ